MNIPLFEKCNVLLSLVINNSLMNRFPISNSTYVQISCVKYIPLLCQIWPTFKQKSSMFYQQSLGTIQTHVPNFLKSLYSLGDKIRTTIQLITYTVPQNCLSLFTINCNSQFISNTKFFSPVDFLYESRHLSKIWLGANVRYRKVHKVHNVLTLMHPFIPTWCYLRGFKYICHIE